MTTASGQAKFEEGKRRYKLVYKDKCVLPLTPYKGSKAIGKYRCLVCENEWQTKPEYILQNKYPCPVCANKATSKSTRVSKKQYKNMLFKKYGDQITLTGKLHGFMQDCTHLCLIHGEFIRTPQTLLRSPKGCQKCNIECRSKNNRYTRKQIDERIKELHGEKIWLASKLLGVDKRHTFKCDEGHKWVTTLDSVLRISGCPNCNTHWGRGVTHSRIQISWINEWRSKLQLSIRAADSLGGEKRLQGKSGKWYRVDGYCKKLNLVFEFDGDSFHGNPNMFKPTEFCHPFDKTLTSAQLYARTQNKIRDLCSAGYDIIQVWENDYHRGKMFSQLKSADTSSVAIPAYVSSSNTKPLNWSAL